MRQNSALPHHEMVEEAPMSGLEAPTKLVKVTGSGRIVETQLPCHEVSGGVGLEETNQTAEASKTDLAWV